MLHPIQRRYWAEDLVRLRRADEGQRYAASQRRGRIDPNPHQIDAVIFALRRVREGGCILADEVGLGKTIEAGLVIAQLLAEGARRVLLILPKPLIGQWKNELYDLFGLETREPAAAAATGATGQFSGTGIFLIGREFAGGERGAAILTQAEPFDLCVIDEAHEIFSGIHKRYTRAGEYDHDSDDAVMAHRVRSFLGMTPVLLLTATPIQNTLMELWGLVQYVEPTGTLLGTSATFRDLFCEPGSGDRSVRPEQVHELRHRINSVCQRTLRRQAQEFLEKPFTRRCARLFEYQMSQPERELYDDVTDYLLEPDLCAFRGRQRRLLLIGFHRRMASSLSALAASLERVAQRLRKMRDGEAPNSGTEADEFAADLEDDELPELEADDAGPPPLGRIEAELARVERFVARAHALPGDAKAEALVRAVSLVLERGRAGLGSGRVVIFTESLTTQQYLAELLERGGLGLEPADITLFRGVNDSPRATEALEHWRKDVGATMPAYSRPSRDVAVRLALVHEFRTRSHIFLSSEAGAKGLNLQFCDTVINYDLPWNPQRIEQRIGRCHRYSQERDVTVINFLNRDNDAERLTFEILSKKLELFGQVLDTSDVVLHEPCSESAGLLSSALGADFESQLRRVYERARSRDELNEGLRVLSETIDEERKRLEETQQRTASLIESRFDQSVRKVFHQISEGLPASLARLDEQVDRVVSAFLEAAQIPFERRAEGEGRVLFKLPASPRLPSAISDGATVVIGHARELADADPLHLGHPLVQAAVNEARAASAAPFNVRLRSNGETSLASYRGRRGQMVLTRVTYQGFEPVQHILVTSVLEGERDPLPATAAEALIRLTPQDAPPFDPPLHVAIQDIDDAVQEAVFLDQAAVERASQTRFERLMEQIDRYADDQSLVLWRQRMETERRWKAAQAERDTAVGADARTRAERKLTDAQTRLDDLDNRIRRLQTRQDADYQKWRAHAHRRRFVQPTMERILDVSFMIE